MRLYHGSSIAVPEPQVSFSRKNLDFGQGFYATSVRRQAEAWAKRKALFAGGSPIVSEYEMNNVSSLRLLEFPDANEKWVEFVCDCRRGGSRYKDYDLIIGGVANDKVYEAVNMYFKKLWDMQTTLDALRFYDINDQYCFVTQRAIHKALVFVGSYEVE